MTTIAVRPRRKIIYLPSLTSLSVRQTYRNVTEYLFAKFARDSGWKYTKRGWPDFLCLDKSGKLFCVEVKKKSKFTGKRNGLKAEQIICLKFLEDHGIKCFLFDGQTMHRFDATKYRLDCQMPDPADMPRRQRTSPG